MKQAVAHSYPLSIFIAGNPDEAQEICRDFCDDVGFCVTVTPTTYVYTGGREAGVIVGLINYPRFPMSPDQLFARAEALAERLRVGLAQESYSIEGLDETIWTSFRAQDNAQGMVAMPETGEDTGSAAKRDQPGQAKPDAPNLSPKDSS